MSEKRSRSQRNLISYTLIAYAVSWVILFPLIYLYPTLDFYIREFWHSLGAIGPAVACVWILSKKSEEKSLDWLKENLFMVPEWRLVLFAFIPLIIFGISILVEFSVGLTNIAEVLKQNNVTNLISLFFLLLPSFSYGFFEEFGWRGYFLPKLQKSFNALKSTLILTVIWYFWHIPMFFYRFDLLFALLFMLPLMLSGSIVFTYLYNESKGSILMVIILHISYDIATSSALSILAVFLVTTFFIMMDIRVIKVYGLESLAEGEKIVI